MTPRPQLTVTAAIPPATTSRKPLRDYAARFGKWAVSSSRRAVDLSWLVSCRDLLLIAGLVLLVHAVHFWSATAAEALGGLMLLWLSWSMSPPSAPPAPPAPKPPSKPDGRI